MMPANEKIMFWVFQLYTVYFMTIRVTILFRKLKQAFHNPLFNSIFPHFSIYAFRDFRLLVCYFPP